MELGKIKKKAVLFSILCTVIVAANFVCWVLSPFMMKHSGGVEPVRLAASMLLYALALLIMANALGMLMSVIRQASPFTEKNVRRLRVVGWGLIVFEPLQYLISLAFPLHFDVHGETFSLSSVSSFGGLFIVAGIAVLCVAMVFRYGVELQTQADETL